MVWKSMPDYMQDANPLGVDILSAAVDAVGERRNRDVANDLMQVLQEAGGAGHSLVREQAGQWTDVPEEWLVQDLLRGTDAEVQAHRVAPHQGVSDQTVMRQLMGNPFDDALSTGATRRKTYQMHFQRGSLNSGMSPKDGEDEDDQKDAKHQQEAHAGTFKFKLHLNDRNRHAAASPRARRASLNVPCPEGLEKAEAVNAASDAAAAVAEEAKYKKDWNAVWSRESTVWLSPEYLTQAQEAAEQHEYERQYEHQHQHEHEHELSEISCEHKQPEHPRHCLHTSNHGTQNAMAAFAQLQQQHHDPYHHAGAGHRPMHLQHGAAGRNVHDPFHSNPNPHHRHAQHHAPRHHHEPLNHGERTQTQTEPRMEHALEGGDEDPATAASRFHVKLAESLKKQAEGNSITLTTGDPHCTAAGTVVGTLLTSDNTREHHHHQQQQQQPLQPLQESPHDEHHLHHRGSSDAVLLMKHKAAAKAETAPCGHPTMARVGQRLQRLHVASLEAHDGSQEGSPSEEQAGILSERLSHDRLSHGRSPGTGSYLARRRRHSMELGRPATCRASIHTSTHGSFPNPSIASPTLTHKSVTSESGNPHCLHASGLGEEGDGLHGGRLMREGGRPAMSRAAGHGSSLGCSNPTAGHASPSQSHKSVTSDGSDPPLIRRHASAGIEEDDNVAFERFLLNKTTSSQYSPQTPSSPSPASPHTKASNHPGLRSSSTGNHTRMEVSHPKEVAAVGEPGNKSAASALVPSMARMHRSQDNFSPKGSPIAMSTFVEKTVVIPEGGIPDTSVHLMRGRNKHPRRVMPS